MLSVFLLDLCSMLSPAQQSLLSFVRYEWQAYGEHVEQTGRLTGAGAENKLEY